MWVHFFHGKVWLHTYTDSIYTLYKLCNYMNILLESKFSEIVQSVTRNLVFVNV